ncbi:SusC/RagA family TonB-linked outer membrane protein [Viscerimonas tarda]
MQKRKSLGFSRRLMWLFAMVMCVQLLCAQAPQRVTGTVYDQAGETLPGASVTIVGASTGTVTDLDGKFTVQAPPNAALKITFTGYLPQTVNLGNKTNVTVTLKEDTKLLEEVVVTALGISREAKSLSYAQQSINTESMADVRASNMMDMLSGKAAGMQIIPGGGPLASTRIVIRGNNSISGYNQPLVVIDGIPIVNDPGMSGEGDDYDYGNAANRINPDEIENIEVLKGANASALYGSEAANGVLLITTKKASRKSGMGISYNYNMMFGTLYNYPTYQNIYGAGQNGRFERDNNGKNIYGMTPSNGWSYNPDLPYGIWMPAAAGQDQRSYGLPMLGFDYIGRNGEMRPYSPHPNNVRDMFKTSTAVTNSISMDKVSDLASLRFSYTNIHAGDILDNLNKLDRHNFNLRSTAKLTDFLDVDANIRYMYENVNNRNGRNSTDRNPMYAIIFMPRDASKEELNPYKRADGTSYTYTGFTNPYWILNEVTNNDDTHQFMGNIRFNIKLPYNITARLTVATDENSKQGWTFVNMNSGWDLDGNYNRFSETRKNNNGEALLSWNHHFTKKLSLSANAGATITHHRTDRIQSSIAILKFPDMKSLDNADGLKITSESDSKRQLQSIFALAAFGYDDWLYFDLTGRNEWNSTLPKQNLSYLYYSVGTSIILSDAFKLDKEILSYAKLRASYAQVGGGTSSDMLFQGYSGSLNPYQGNTYFLGSNVRLNPLLKPEITRSSELGLDLRFLDNRVSVDMTYYTKQTTDLITQADAPLASGFEREVINAGKIKNYGYEVSLSATPIKNNTISWTTTINWSKNVSKVVELSEGVDRFQMGSGQNIGSYLEVGKPFGVFYGNDYRRDAQGRIKLALDGKPTFDPNQYLGTIEPNYFGGWKNTVRVGAFDFGSMIDFQHGGHVWSFTAWQGARDGQNVQSLAGRLEYLWSDLVLRESGTERQGFLEAQYTVQANTNNYENHVLYPDWQRPKGVQIGNAVYDESVPYWGDQVDEYGNPISISATTWTSPMNHWVHTNASSARRSIYDASYVKLRELSLGYNLPNKFLRNTPIRSVRISAVGRNLAIIHSNLPRGIDPQATSSVGNNQGFEKGFSLPQANYGFDIKLSF